MRSVGNSTATPAPRASSRPILALGLNRAGEKELLGLWIAESEGAKFWLQVLTRLLCVVHMMRNNLNFVAWNDRKMVASDSSAFIGSAGRSRTRRLLFKRGYQVRLHRPDVAPALTDPDYDF